MSKKIIFILFITVTGFAPFTVSNAQVFHKTDRFSKLKFGLSFHYLFNLQNKTQPWNMGRQTSWDDCVNNFNVKKFAADVAATGAGYVIFTVQQGDQYFCAPNITFEKLSGIKRGNATSRRDLINDLYYALRARKIDLFLYVTGNGPFANYEVMDKLTKKNFHNRVVNNAYQVEKKYVETWSSILMEYSKRYQTKIKGWWVDGAYPFIGYNDTLLAIVSKALKAGNKNALVAFNPAPKDTVSYYTKLDDYTAGEIYHINSWPKKRFLKGVQWHVITFLGSDWAQPDLRFTQQQVSNYIKKCNTNGGVVTFDACVLRDGSVSKKQKDFLTGIKNNKQL